MGLSLGSLSLPAAAGCDPKHRRNPPCSPAKAASSPGSSLQQVGTLLEDPGGIRQRAQAGGSQLRRGAHRLEKSLLHSLGSRKERKTRRGYSLQQGRAQNRHAEPQQRSAEG